MGRKEWRKFLNYHTHYQLLYNIISWKEYNSTIYIVCYIHCCWLNGWLVDGLFAISVRYTIYIHFPNYNPIIVFAISSWGCWGMREVCSNYCCWLYTRIYSFLSLLSSLEWNKWSKCVQWVVNGEANVCFLWTFLYRILEIISIELFLRISFFLPFYATDLLNKY